MEEAILVYQQALASKPLPCSNPWFFSTVQLRFGLAELYREKGDFAHAIPEYRTAVQFDHGDERYQIGLINALQDSGDIDAAIAESKEAIRIWPDKYFHYLLGRALIKKNDLDAAIFELQWVLKMTKNHFSQANCKLGRAYEAKGDLQAAVHQYRTAFQAHVNDEQCRASYERLQLQLRKRPPDTSRGMGTQNSKFRP